MLKKNPKTLKKTLSLKAIAVLIVSMLCTQSILIASSTIPGKSHDCSQLFLSDNHDVSPITISAITPPSQGDYFVYQYEFANIQLTNGTYIVGYQNDLIQLILRLEVISNSSTTYSFEARFESQNNNKYQIDYGFTFDYEISSGAYEITNGSRSGEAGILRLFADSSIDNVVVLSSIEGHTPLSGTRNTYTDTPAIRFDGDLQKEFDFYAVGDDIFNNTHESSYFFDLDTGLLFWITNAPMDFFMLGMVNITYGSGKIDLIQTNYDLGEAVVVLPIPLTGILIIMFGGAFILFFGISVKALKNSRRRHPQSKKKKGKKSRKREL